MTQEGLRINKTSIAFMSLVITVIVILSSSIAYAVGVKDRVDHLESEKNELRADVTVLEKNVAELTNLNVRIEERLKNIEKTTLDNRNDIKSILKETANWP